jgi:hypothetical protein
LGQLAGIIQILIIHFIGGYIDIQGFAVDEIESQLNFRRKDGVCGFRFGFYAGWQL